MEFDVRTPVILKLGSLLNRGTRDLRLLALSVFGVNFCMGSYTAAYTNFVVQSLRIKPEQLGVVESLREMPGFLIIIMAALTMRVAEPIVAAGSLLMLAVGVGAFYTVHSIPSLILYSVIWSVGIHAWMIVQPSMAMSLADEGSKGRRLGQMGSIAAFSNICGMLMVFSIGGRIGFGNIFLIAGAAAGIGTIFVSMISRNIGHTEKPRMVWKRKYSLYYWLTLLEGCRKQVFLTFAVFALVRNFHTPMSTVAALMIVNNVVNMSFAAKVGRIIDRIGERKVLATCYSLLIPVFIGYAFVKQAPVLYVLYCLDNLLYLGSIGLTTYLQKIAEPRDLMPSLAMGVSMNHTAAVIVPVTGGLLWAAVGYPATFIAGTLVVFISVLMALRIRTPALAGQAAAAEGAAMTEADISYPPAGES